MKEEAFQDSSIFYNDVDSLVSRMLFSNLLFDDFNQKKDRQRMTMLKETKVRSSYGNINQLVVTPYSSDEDSIEIQDDEELPIEKEPSVNTVCEYLFDYKTLKVINSEDEKYPEGVYPGLLAKNVDDDLQAIDLKTIIEKNSVIYSQCVSIEEIRIFKNQTINYAFISFSTVTDCQIVYNIFSENIKQNGSRNSMEVLYCYDISDHKLSYWYGVVLRNIDESCTKEKVRDYCSMFTTGVRYSLAPTIVCGSMCAVVVTDELDDAETICASINQKAIMDIFTGRTLKANIHPKSCKIRKNPSKSHFAYFFRTGDNKFNPVKIECDSTSQYSKDLKMSPISRNNIIEERTDHKVSLLKNMFKDNPVQRRSLTEKKPVSINHDHLKSLFTNIKKNARTNTTSNSTSKEAEPKMLNVYIAPLVPIKKNSKTSKRVENPINKTEKTNNLIVESPHSHNQTNTTDKQKISNISLICNEKEKELDIEVEIYQEENQNSQLPLNIINTHINNFDPVKNSIKLGEGNTDQKQKNKFYTTFQKLSGDHKSKKAK